MRCIVKRLVAVTASCLLAFPVFFFSGEVLAGPPSGDGDMAMGMPFGVGSEAAEVDLCPQGAMVVEAFLAAWRAEDFKTMYELIDDESKKDYPFEQARFDFQFMEFKEYKISSVREDGDNFEFFLSYGDWKDGDKDMKKMIINGKTFKIIMPTRNSPFKESIDKYF